jgi:hypothetical protein
MSSIDYPTGCAGRVVAEIVGMLNRSEIDVATLLFYQLNSKAILLPMWFAVRDRARRNGAG